MKSSAAILVFLACSLSGMANGKQWDNGRLRVTSDNHLLVHENGLLSFG
ncbi:MAG: hypothetical protein ACM3NR_01580 [Methanosarcina sp.]